MLLFTGNMPVLPRAPREWTAVPEESAILKGWRSYSPEEKGVVTEYAAGVLEMANGIYPIQRQLLLYKYSHRSLTGFILPPNADMKMLYYSLKQRHCPRNEQVLYRSAETVYPLSHTQRPNQYGPILHNSSPAVFNMK